MDGFDFGKLKTGMQKMYNTKFISVVAVALFSISKLCHCTLLFKNVLFVYLYL